MGTAARDTEEKARAKSFRLLGGIVTEGTKPIREMLVRTGTLDVPSSVQDDAWAYLLYTATPEDVNDLRNNIAGTWLEERMDWLDAWISSGRELDRFLQQKLDATLIPEAMARSIETELPRLSDESLKVLASANRRPLRAFAIAELLERGVPADDSHSPPSKLSWLGLLSAPSGGSAQSGESDEDRYRRLSQYSSSELGSKSSFYSVDGPIIYRLLAERGEIARETVREDVSTQFSRVLQQDLGKLTEQFGPDGAAEYRRDFEKYREFLTRLFTEQAFKYLAAHPTQGDLRLARDFVSHGDARPSAVQIIASVGDATDVEKLIEIANSSYGGERDSAIAGIP